MSQIILFFLELQSNIKMYHWMTTSYARHKAADNLVDSIIENGDKFIEVYIGRYGRPTVTKRDASILQVQNLDDKSVIKYIEDSIKYLVIELSKNLKKEDVDLLNIRDELICSLSQTKYLFTLQWHIQI